MRYNGEDMIGMSEEEMREQDCALFGTVNALVGRIEWSAKRAEKASLDEVNPETTRRWDAGRAAGLRDAISLIQQHCPANSGISGNFPPNAIKGTK